MSYLTQHLLKRTSGFYFRLVVPKRLRLALGKSEIRHPLRTSSEFNAVQLSKRLWAHYQTVFENLNMSRPKLNDHVFGYEVQEMTITNSSVTLKGVKTEGDEDSRNLLEYTQKVQRSLQGKPETFIDLSAFDNVAQPEDELNTKLN